MEVVRLNDGTVRCAMEVVRLNDGTVRWCDGSGTVK